MYSKCTWIHLKKHFKNIINFTGFYRRFSYQTPTSDSGLFWSFKSFLPFPPPSRDAVTWKNMFLCLICSSQEKDMDVIVKIELSTLKTWVELCNISHPLLFKVE